MSKTGKLLKHIYYGQFKNGAEDLHVDNANELSDREGTKRLVGSTALYLTLITAELVRNKPIGLAIVTGIGGILLRRQYQNTQTQHIDLMESETTIKTESDDYRDVQSIPITDTSAQADAVSANYLSNL
ncbi:MAG TPA: hypothetical protein VLF90_03250 [Patescibacteria group bacterium]|nr:hypothetical protein [Patescibacteria group bacterium]